MKICLSPYEFCEQQPPSLVVELWCSLYPFNAIVGTLMCKPVLAVRHLHCYVTDTLALMRGELADFHHEG